MMFSTEPRRAKAVFNVLRGRRTVSTLFAGLTYDCLSALDSWHGVPMEKFLASLQELLTAGDLATPMEGYVQLTTAGAAHKEQLQATLYQPVAFQAFQTIDVRRFTAISALALQVASQAVHHQNRYYPLTTDPGIQAIVKQWFRRQTVAHLGEQLHTELTTFLQSLPAPLPTVFVASISGFENPGQTDQQLATQLDKTPLEILVMRKDLACRWCLWLETQPQSCLVTLLQPLVKSNPVTPSAWQTYQTVQQGLTVEQVAIQRRLKLSTVREHLLEVAILVPSFPYKQVLTPARLQTLTEIFANQPVVANWRFEQVQAVAPEMDFFWFRLFQIMRCQTNAA